MLPNGWGCVARPIGLEHRPYPPSKYTLKRVGNQIPQPRGVVCTPCYAKWFCLIVENFGALHFLPLRLKFYELSFLQLIQGGFCAVAQYFFRQRFLRVNFLGLICFLTATHSSRFHFLLREF